MALSINVDQEKQLTVTADNELNYTPLVSWTSSDPTKATVSSSGVLKGVATGSATITVTYLPAGATEALTAQDTVTVSA